MFTRLQRKRYVVIFLVICATCVYRWTSFPGVKEEKLSIDVHDIKSLPKMTLTIRMTSRNILTMVYCILFKSISLYWSSQLGNVGLILDAESHEDKQLAINLANNQAKMGITFDFFYEPLPKDTSIFNNFKQKPPGYNRQLYSSFLMDQYIQTPIVAWIDSDAKFTTPVTPENIFQDNKLRVKGMNTFRYPGIDNYDQITQIMTGKPMPTDFMTFFPVYIWRDTITNCRNHILKHMHSSSMEDAFGEASKHGFVSSVNVIMTYAFYFERERYDWHIDIHNPEKEFTSLQKYNTKHVLPGHALTASDLTIDLHVSVHNKYYGDRERTLPLNNRAYCAAANNTSIMADKQMQITCRSFNGRPMWPLFEFVNRIVSQGHLYTWCKHSKDQCASLIQRHYVNVRRLIEEGVYELDLRKLEAIDNAAKAMATTCYSFL